MGFSWETKRIGYILIWNDKLTMIIYLTEFKYLNK